MDLYLNKTKQQTDSPEQMMDLLHRCAKFVCQFKGDEISIAKLPAIIKKLKEFNKSTDLKQLFEDLEKYE